MKITVEQVRYVADLANLHLTDDEVRKFQTDLDEILVHIDRLNEVDTAEYDAMAQVLYETEETATLRPDRPRPGLGTELAVVNAPAAGSGYFKVPEVIKR